MKNKVGVITTGVVVLSATILLSVILWFYLSAEPTKSVPQAVPDSAHTAQQTHLAPLLWLLLLTIFVCGCAVAVALRLVYWSKALEGGQRSLVPNALLDEWAWIKSELAQLVDQSQKIEAENNTALRSIDENTSALRESLAIFTDSLSRKDGEIDRLKKGADAVVFGRFLHRFIKLHAALQDEIDDARENGRDASVLQDLIGLLEDALLESGAEKFVPKIGAAYKDEFGVADSPRLENTQDPAKDGLIKSVYKPGFRSATGQVFEHAKVVVYRAQV